MANFLIYLIESGLCLALFYLGYIIFFRKETYFSFNRLYLLGSMVLALLMPLSTVSLQLSDMEYLSETYNRIGQFRNFYEELVLITDPEYAVSYDEVDSKKFSDGNTTVSVNQQTNNSSSFGLLQLLFIIYIGGLLFFATRLCALVYGVFRFIKKNKTVVKNGYVMVFIKEEVPSFSFLKWVFVNKEALKHEEFEQVLAHEKVHVQHKHSVDLLLAHIITTFQWFNPLTWRLQKSLKTCHEYIADRQVLNQGHELFDYQSLLLSQLISIRSVELVNNFNLLSIKKRIAMMNKIKSGRIAKFKAILIIPMLVIAFLFFANMTGKSFGDNMFTNDVISVAEASNYKVDLPMAKEVKTFDKDFILCRLTLTKDGFYYNGSEHDLNKVDHLISTIKLPSDKNKTNKMTVLLEIDKAVKMGRVDKIKAALRKYNHLKIGYVSKSDDTKFAGEETALFARLPPHNAKLVDEKIIKNLFEIKYSDKENSIDELEKYIKSYKKYVMIYKYDNATLYKDYISVTSGVWSTVNKLRREEAILQGSVYDEMSKEDQKKLRKKYPILLTFRNLDED